MTKRIVGYARVSKREQAQNSNALEQQIERLKQAGATEIYSDVQSGFKKKARPQLEQLLDLVRQSKVDEVIATRINRLARDNIKGSQVLGIFIESGVVLRTLDQNIDLSTAAGRTMAHMLMVFGSSESDFKTEAVKAGTAYRRQQKKAWHPPFGYRMSDEEKYIFDDQEYICLLDGKRVLTVRDIARERIELYLKERSLRRTARAINDIYGVEQASKVYGRPGLQVSPSGLRNWLNNPVLRGHTPYLRGQEIAWNTHSEQRLMTDREFEAIKEVKAVNQKVGGWGAQAQRRHPMSGLVHCDVCKGSCYTSKSGASKNRKPRDYYYYYCHHAAAGTCTNKPYIRAEVIEDALIDALVARADAIAKNVATDLADQDIDSELQRLQAELETVKNMMGASSDTGGFLAQHVAMLQSQIAQRENEPSSIDEAKRSELAEVGRDPTFWRETLGTEEKLILYPHFVKAIWIRAKTVIAVDLQV
ncbi:fdxN element excision recombinase XisF [Leptothoe sp. EHU-05/26/07-4]